MVILEWVLIVVICVCWGIMVIFGHGANKVYIFISHDWRP